MEKVDFCFLIPEVFADAKHGILISEEVEKRGYSSFFITTSEAGDIVFREAGLSNFQNLDRISNEIDIKDIDLEEKILDIEKTFGIENIRTEILTHKLVFKEKNEEPLIKKVAQYILALDNFFSKEIEAKYLIQGMAGSLTGAAFYYIGKKRGKHIFFSSSPFRGLINFSFHPWGLLEIDNKDKDLKKNTLKNEDRKFILNYINKAKKEKELNVIRPFSEANPCITKERFKRFFSLIKNYKLQKLPLFFIVKNFWKRYFRQFYVRKFYNQPKHGEKYIFFPLHFPDDSQLTVRAIPFLSQEFIVEILSRYLPYGYKIYVKGHPAALGCFSIGMLKYIAKIPHVKLIPPEINSHDLIKNSEIVCVINSTVGFVALMYKKPVITFGESFYSEKGVTLDVKNLYDLPNIINRAKDFKPDWNKILALFNLWYKNSFLPTAEKTIYGSKDPTKKDIRIFCDSLLKYLKLI